MADLDPVKIPKNNVRSLLGFIGALLVLAAVVLMFVGFIDAGTTTPEETEGPAPPVDTPRTVPR